MNIVVLNLEKERDQKKMKIEYEEPKRQINKNCEHLDRVCITTGDKTYRIDYNEKKFKVVAATHNIFISINDTLEKFR